MGAEEEDPPVFKAVSSSARQLYQLLNCIRFAPKVYVQISSEGIRFTVEESRVLQGMLLDQDVRIVTYNVTRSCIPR